MEGGKNLGSLYISGLHLDPKHTYIKITGHTTKSVGIGIKIEPLRQVGTIKLVGTVGEDITGIIIHKCPTRQLKPEELILFDGLWGDGVA